MPRASFPPSKSKKPKKGSAATPTTSEDFLAFAVSHEESAEKWRAGDAVKSARFYGRALATYTQALTSLELNTDDRFDFEYNRARVLLTLAESRGLLRAWGKIVKEFMDLELRGEDEEAMLRSAIEGFRRALSVKDEKDALFNLSQALGSLADAMVEDREDEARTLLKEAVEVLEKCLIMQEASFSASRELVAQWNSEEHDKSTETPQAQTEDDDSEGDSASASGSVSGGQWASVQEPVTAQTLVETGLALMEMLERVIDLATCDPNTLQTTEALADKLIKDRLPVYLVEASDATIEVAVASARLRGGLLEAAFRSERLDMGQYSAGLRSLFESDLVAKDTAEGLVAYSEALTDFATAVASTTSTPVAEAATQRWHGLSKALELLTQASKHAQVREVARVHLGRGDVELMRLMLSLEGQLAEKLGNRGVQATLIKNAGTFYRGAANLAQSRIGSLTGAGSVEMDTWRSATMRGMIAGAFAGSLANAGDQHVVVSGAELKAKGIEAAEMQEEVRRLVEESVLSEGAAREIVVGPQ